MQSFSSPPLPREPGERRRPARALLAPAARSKRPRERRGATPAPTHRVGGLRGRSLRRPQPAGRAVGALPPAGPRGGGTCPDARPNLARPDGRSGPDARSRRGLGPCHRESPGAAATSGARRGRRPLRPAVDRPSSRASGHKPGISSTPIYSRGARPARPLGSEAPPPPPASLPNPHSLGLARAPTPTPHSARALPRPRARAEASPLAPRTRIGRSLLAARRGSRACSAVCGVDACACSSSMIAPHLLSKS